MSTSATRCVLDSKSQDALARHTHTHEEERARHNKSNNYFFFAGLLLKREHNASRRTPPQTNAHTNRPPAMRVQGISLHTESERLGLDRQHCRREQRQAKCVTNENRHLRRQAPQATEPRSHTYISIAISGARGPDRPEAYDKGLNAGMSKYTGKRLDRKEHCDARQPPPTTPPT